MASMVAFAAVIAAGLFVLPYALREAPPAATPKQPIANLVINRPSEPAAIVKRIGPAPIQPVQTQPAAASAPVPAHAETAAPAVNPMFRVEHLPTLEAEAAFDVDQLAGPVAAPPARAAQKPASLRKAQLAEQGLSLPQP